MSKKSRSRRRQKKKKNFVKPATAKSAVSVETNLQLKDLLDKNKFSEIIALLEPQSKQRQLTDFELGSLAFALIEEKDKDNSEQALDYINKINRPSNKDLQVKGRCYIYEEKWDEAISLLDKLYKEDSNSTTLYYLSRALLKSRDICELFGKKYRWDKVDEDLKDDATISKLKNLLSDGIKKDFVYLGFFNWLEEILYYENGERVYEDHRNVKLLQSALEIFPNDEELRLKLATRFQEVSDIPQTLDTLTWALESENPTGEIFVGAIDILIDIDMPDKAIEFFNKADELVLFIGDEKEILKIKLLFKANLVEEANSLIDNGYVSSSNSKYKFGLLIQKTLYEISKANFPTAVEFLGKAVEILEDFTGSENFTEVEDEFLNIPDIFFKYKSSYNSDFTYYVLHSGEIENILYESIENLIPYLTNLDDKRFEASIQLLSSNYVLFADQTKYSAVLQKLLDLILSKKANPEHIWYRLRRLNFRNEDYFSGFNAHIQYCLSGILFNSDIEAELNENSWDNDKHERIPIEPQIDKTTALKIHKHAFKQFKNANSEHKEKIYISVF